MSLPNDFWRAGYTEESYRHHVRVVRAWKAALVIALVLAIIAACTH